MTASPKDRRILESWHANAGRWTAAVRSGAIASRRAGTDSAILGAIVEAVARLLPACIPGHVLDLGCGEGWLTRRLRAEAGCRVTGADGSAELVRLAREADPSERGVHATSLTRGREGSRECHRALVAHVAAEQVQPMRRRARRQRRS